MLQIAASSVPAFALIAGALAGMMVLLGVAATLYFQAFYRKLEPGTVGVLNTMKQQRDVVRTGMAVMPVIHRLDILSSTPFTVSVPSGLGFPGDRLTVQIGASDEAVLAYADRFGAKEEAEVASAISQLLGEVAHLADPAAAVQAAQQLLKAYGLEVVAAAVVEESAAV